MTLAVGHQRPAAPIGFQPGLTVGDPLAAHWLAQATLRLRREVAWLWHERSSGTVEGALPPVTDKLSEALDLVRYDGDRRAFFATDEAASWLSERIALPAPAVMRPARGSFSWVRAELGLADVDCLALALALGGVIDSASGSVIAACQNDPSATLPTLSLMQRLWDAPTEVLELLDPNHPLQQVGIFEPAPATWSDALRVESGVAQRLLFPQSPVAGGIPLASAASEGEADLALAIARLKARPANRVTILPISGPDGAPRAETAARIGRSLGLEVVEPAIATADLGTLAVIAWLAGKALYVPFGVLVSAEATLFTRIARLPIVIFAGLSETHAVAKLPPQLTAARLRLPPLAYEARRAAWARELPEVWAGEKGREALTECARRFRYEETSIARVVASLRALGHPPSAEEMFDACRADLDLGDLAQPVTPRFTLEELMLPARQTAQIAALVEASRMLTRVHHDWGTARAWNESGLSALFSGPPGTGKTMAAEAIAAAVHMPIYRIDLSQVVNKYIGETEKNLRRLFDAADAADVILFFDEADALFGKRTEVKDAHDRYANLEVSYLLERMERFKGMAILASNRKKDLDEAFMRRLRFVVQFPLPGPEERLRIWRAVIPAAVDASALDLEFLAERIALSGGHIRSAVFNACLASAGRVDTPRLEMAPLVRAIKDEFDKLGRAVSLDQFGPHAEHVRE